MAADSAGTSSSGTTMSIATRASGCTRRRRCITDSPLVSVSSALPSLPAPTPPIPNASFASFRNPRCFQPLFGSIRQRWRCRKLSKLQYVTAEETDAGFLGPTWLRSTQQRSRETRETMEPSEVQRALEAGRSTASALGLRVDDGVVVHNSNRIAVRLTPCDVLARVAPLAHRAGAELEV